jgi:hypothetical protein
MKAWLLLAVALPGLACGASQTVQVVYEDAAVISFCKPGLLGCAERIAIGAESYLLDVSAANKDLVGALRKTYADRKVYETTPGRAVGFVVTEKGHFPNPTAAFKVFKLLDASFPQPR